jgi:hypothetical protein
MKIPSANSIEKTIRKYSNTHRHSGDFHMRPTTEGRGSRYIPYCPLPLLHCHGTMNALRIKTRMLTWQHNSYRHGTLPALYIIRSSANHRLLLHETMELYGSSITDTRKLRIRNTSLILVHIKVAPPPNNVIVQRTVSTLPKKQILKPS